MKYLMQSIKDCPRYSQQELIDLGREYREWGDMHAREQMILGILPLAINRARKYFYAGRQRGMSMEELCSDAVTGVIMAVERFDPDKERSLATYAIYWIDQYLRKGLYNCGIIHTPEYLNRVEEGHRFRDFADAAHRISSLGEYPDMEDELEDHRVEDINTKVQEFDEQNRIQEWVWNAITEIEDERIRDILTCRLQGWTLNMIGNRHGCSREWIRQLEQRGHKQLKEILLATQEPLEEISAA